MPLDMPERTAAGDRFDSHTEATRVRQEGSYRIRTLLMMQLREMRRVRGLTQVQAARWFGVSQPRISHLAQNRTNRFTADTLINMIEHAGTRIRVTFEGSLDAACSAGHDGGSRSRERSVR
jgi:predicted XRE-type DNA-binding protein